MPSQVEAAKQPDDANRLSPVLKVSRQFSPNERAVRQARRFALSVVSGDSQLEHDLGLAASELAANAVIHARTPFTVTVSRSDDIVRLEITDDAGVDLAVNPVASPLAGGRGLRIVGRIALAWGAMQTARGKTIWADFDASTSLSRSDDLAGHLAVIRNCATACRHCADALVLDGGTELHSPMQWAIDCADLCIAALKLLERHRGEVDAAIADSLVQVVGQVCGRCGDVIQSVDTAGHPDVVGPVSACVRACRDASEMATA